jgi:hypothetical protein
MRMIIRDILSIFLDNSNRVPGFLLFLFASIYLFFLSLFFSSPFLTLFSSYLSILLLVVVGVLSMT